MAHRLIRLIPLLSALAAAHAAEPATLEDRLRTLESKVEVLQQENTALRRQLGTPEPSAKSHAAPASDATTIVPVPSGHESKLVIGGFTQMQAEFGGVGDARFTGATDRIYVRRSRLSVGGSFAEHFEFRVDGEFGAGSTLPATGIRAQANELLLGWSRYPGASVRIGQLKAAYSAELLAIEYKGPLVERSIGAERVGDSRQVGAAVNGDFLGGRVGYVVFVGNGSGSNSSANDNNKFLQTAHVYAVPVDSPAAGRLLLGASALHSNDAGIAKLGPGFDAVAGGTLDNLFAGTRDGWGLDALWHTRLAELSTELLRVRYRPLNAIPMRSFDSESWQMTASYYVVPQFVQAALRFEHFDPNTARAGDSTNNWMAGLSYYIKGDDLRLLVGYLFGHAAGLTNEPGRLLTRFQIVY